MSENRDRIAEILALSEDPREPMGTYTRVDLLEPTTETALRQAVSSLTSEHEKLRSYPAWERGAVVWHQSSQLAGIIVPSGISEEEFYTAPIPFGPMPVWRVWLENDRRLHIATHHVMADGIATLNLIILLVRALTTESDKPPEPLKMPKFTKIDESKWSWTVRLVRTLLRQNWFAKFYPPVLVGPRRIEGPLKIGHLYRQYSNDELKKLRDCLRSRAEALPLLDLMLVALHLAIQDYMLDQKRRGVSLQGGDNRIAVLLPFDRRGYQELPMLFWNCVGTVNIVSYLADRRNVERLIKKIKAQVETITTQRKHSSSYTVVEFFTKNPPASIGSSNPSENAPPEKPADAWRFENTACLSYIQMRTLPKDVNERISALYGVPPVRTPLGISIGIGEMTGGMTFCLRYSTASLTSDAASFIFERFDAWIRDIGMTKV